MKFCLTATHAATRDPVAATAYKRPRPCRKAYLSGIHYDTTKVNRGRLEHPIRTISPDRSSLAGLLHRPATSEPGLLWLTYPSGVLSRKDVRSWRIWERSSNYENNHHDNNRQVA